jgi:hypothetical protein
MEEEKRGEKLDTEISEESAGEQTLEISAADTMDLEEEQPVPALSSPRESRSRLIRAGLVATVILSGVAVLVAGIFQLTSRWLIPCPTDLPINDPAPILWTRLISDKVGPASLGLPKGVAVEVRLKSFAPAASAEHNR